jgi:4-hydroxybenzoate polyprenyltransferase
MARDSDNPHPAAMTAQSAVLPSQSSGANAARLIALDIKLAHSIFALPFAILAAAMALPPDQTWLRTMLQFVLIVLCMVTARTWAMLANRLLDREIDAANPRTSRRAFAKGDLAPATGWMYAFGSALLFIASAGGFVRFGNWWPLVLSVPVLAYIAFYSLTKRFTMLCHLVLGTALALSPLAAALAVDPTSVGLSADGLSSGDLGWVGGGNAALGWLAVMVACWVAGFDVIYALQDQEFDRARGLHSIPAALGWQGAAWVSRVLHIGALVALVMAARSEPRFGVVFAMAVGLVGVLLVAEHVVLAKRGKQGLDMAFFTLNGVVSVVVGVLGVVDVVW